MSAAGFDKPISERDLLAIVKAGATIYADQYVAGLERGLNGMLAKGFVFDARFLSGLSTAARRRIGFSS